MLMYVTGKLYDYYDYYHEQWSEIINAASVKQCCIVDYTLLTIII
jgi:hypothetical protein